MVFRPVCYVRPEVESVLDSGSNRYGPRYLFGAEACNPVRYHPGVCSPERIGRGLTTFLDPL